MSIRVEEIRSAAAALAVIVLLHGTASAQNRIVAAPRSDVVETDSATLPASLIRTPKAVPAPPSRRFFGAHVEAAQTIVVEPPDTTALESEDSTSTEKCRRVGVTLAVDHDPARVRGWRSDGAEGRFWTGEIDAPNARSMRVHFTQFALPPGAQVFVHAADDLENVFGPFEGTGIYPNGEFWSQTIGGERVVVEYWEPKVLQTNKLPFRIADIVYDYADPDAPTSQLGGSCEQDATCFPGFAFEGDAVGRMRFVDGTNAFVCTGTLLTTIAGDWTPYFLTANH
ncbi:MAG: hypothetical protein HY292_17460 [Planctomycetes bacterium]|nr:hypothetical protein [Planctomycetota bacterium]